MNQLSKSDIDSERNRKEARVSAIDFTIEVCSLLAKQVMILASLKSPLCLALTCSASLNLPLRGAARANALGGLNHLITIT